MGFRIDGTSIQQKLLELSIEGLAHRGPDFRGISLFEEGAVGLAHSRLSIIDPDKRSHQPMRNNKLVLSFNGEIYNHLRLRENIDYHFKTQSDTETVLAGLSQEGISFLNKCRGMFAGAVYDCESKNIFIFRDSLGIKNLYYSLESNIFIFGSEIKAMLPIFKKQKRAMEFCSNSIREYLTYENYQNSTSIFKGVNSLLPGEIFLLKPSFEVEKRRIKPVKSFEFDHNNDDLINVGRKVLEDSVKKHLLSDYPVGVYLSGGIDSSLVAAMAARENKDLIGFTGYFDVKNSHYDERALSRSVAKKLNIPLREVSIKPNHFSECFDKLVYHLETPKMGMGSFSQFVVAQTAAEERRVILSGHGGDELFAGYPLFKAFWMAEKQRILKGVNLKEIPWVGYFFLKLIKSGESIFAPKIFDLDFPQENVFKAKGRPKISSLMSYYKETYIPGLLEVEDKVSMAHSLETRTPLWDLRVMSFASQVAVDQKMKGGKLKYLLKEIARPYLPPELLSAPKRGFPTPLKLWFKNELSDFVKERLLKKSDILDMIMSIEDRETLLTGSRLPHFHAFDEIWAHKVWMLLNLESVERQFGVSIE